MKRKIFALIVCAACLVSVLTACSGAGSCTTCQDLDKNSKCDVCGIPVVTIVENVPKEEEVKEMVVNPIPDNAKLSDLLDLTAIKDIIPAGATTVDFLDNDHAQTVANFILIEYTETVTEDEENPDNNVYLDVYKLYDPAKGKVVLTLDSGNYTAETESRKTKYEFNSLRTPLYPIDYITVYTETRKFEKAEDGDYYNEVTEYTFYTMSMEKIVTSNELFYSYGRSGEMLSMVIDDVRYLIDPATDKVIYSVNDDAYIPRPEFSAVRGNLGFVLSDGVVSVFDLTKWIECIYNYQVPAYYNDAKVFYLENGNILVQGLVTVPQASANYDVLVSGVKYDVVYTVVNPQDKTVNDVEFGYYIEELSCDFDENYKASAKNRVTVKAIEAKQLSNQLTLIVDNDLNVTASEEKLLPAFVKEMGEIVANNRMLAQVVYGEGSTVNKIIDGSGKVIATLPNSAVVKGGYIEIDGKYYDFDMQLKLDLEEDGYTLVNERNDYILVAKDGDIYYWAADAKAPQLVADVLDDSVEGTTKVQSIGTVDELGFVVVTNTAVTGEEPSNTTTYTLYNTLGAKVVEVDKYITDFSEFYGAEGVYRITLTDGTWYFAR